MLSTEGAARLDLCLTGERRNKEGALTPPAAVDIFTALDNVRAAVHRGSTCIVRRIGSAASAGRDRHCSALRKGTAIKHNAKQCNADMTMCWQFTNGGNALL